MKTILDDEFEKGERRGIRKGEARGIRKGEARGIKRGIRKGEAKPDGSGNYPDKNVLLEAITPDHQQWHTVEQQPPFPKPSGGVAAAPASGGGQVIQRPDWSH